MKNIILISLFLVIAISCRERQPQVIREYKQQEKQAEKANQPKPVWPPAPDASKPLAVAPDPLVKNYLVVFDGSGSMNDDACKSNETKMNVAKKALLAFADSLSADANLGLIHFEPISVLVPLGVGNRQQFKEQVSQINPNGGTPLGDSMEVAYKALTEQAQKQLGYGEFYLVMVTDGENTVGPDPRQMVDFIVQNTPIVVYTIGFCIGQNHSLNRSGITTYREAGNLEELTQALEGVQAEAPDFTALTFE